MGVTKRLPWWTKIALKIALSKLPLSHGCWRRFGIFRHGDTDDPNRAIETFERYYQRANKYSEIPSGFCTLELGPGDSILTGIVSRSYGASCTWLIDTGSFAGSGVESCQILATRLNEEMKALPAIEGVKNVEEVLELLDIRYLTSGTQSLAQIPDSSVDFFWSQVVLEHVGREEFPQFLSHLRRVAKPSAVGVHSIDFRDHLSGGLNNLRFSTTSWESSFFRNAGFYTNRFRPREMLAMFSDAGFSVEVLAETRWSEMPIKRRQLANEFREYPDEDFMVAEVEVLLQPV